MRRLLIAGVSAAFALNVQSQDGSGSLSTVPQQDGSRARSSPATVSISADGRFVAFASLARLARADTNDGADLYVLDRDTNEVTLESTSPSGDALGCVSRPRISADGRILVFEAMQLIRGGPHFVANVAVRDRAAGTTRFIEGVAGAVPNGWTGAPAASDDGHVIVFTSNATNLVEGPDGNGSDPDVYLLRRSAGTIQRLVAEPAAAGSTNSGSMTPAVSGDGRYVAFASHAGAKNLRIHIRDTVRNVTSVIPVSANGPSITPVLSRDGEYLAFTSFATNVVRADRNRAADVFLYEAKTGQILLVSRSVSGGAANGESRNPAISADGRYVAFQSDASDLVCTARRCPEGGEDINLLPDIFVFDRVTGAIEWVSTGGGRGWIEESVAPALDGSGRLIAFSSRHPIHAEDLANDFDLFLRVGR